MFSTSACEQYACKKVHPQIDDSVVQTGVKKHALELHIFCLGLWGLWPVGIVDREGQDSLQPRNKV